MDAIPTLDDMLAARDRIRPHVHVTPVLTSRMLDELTGAQLFFKCENLQKAGAFKARGASNAVFALSDAQAARGVATHSSGNHGTCLSYAAGRRGIPCTPIRCIGKNVRLKPMNVAQKWIFPSRSLYIRPVIFGNQ